MKHFFYISSFLILTAQSIKAQNNEHSGYKKRDTISLDKRGRLMDIDGNKYRTVRIGDQIWMAENLKTTRVADGTVIPTVQDAVEWDLTLSPAMCWYNNNSSKYKDKSGALYNWYTVEKGDLCPTGWHVPSDSEWVALKEYELTAGINKFEEGSALKAKGDWKLQYNRSTITDPFGFSAYTTGNRSSGCIFEGDEFAAYWWSSTSWSFLYAWSHSIVTDNDIITRSKRNMKDGLSVRCIKDRSE